MENSFFSLTNSSSSGQSGSKGSKSKKGSNGFNSFEDLGNIDYLKKIDSIYIFSFKDNSEYYSILFEGCFNNKNTDTNQIRTTWEFFSTINMEILDSVSSPLIIEFINLGDLSVMNLYDKHNKKKKIYIFHMSLIIHV